MKVNEGLSVLFWVRKSKISSDGMMPIYVRFTVNTVRESFSSGKKVRPEHWNDELGIAVKSCPDYKSINAYVQQTTRELEKHYDRLRENGSLVTAAMLKESYLPNPTAQKSLMQAFDLHNNEFAELVSIDKAANGTLVRYKRSKRKAEEFLLKKLKKNDISLSDIKFEMAPAFYHYLIMNDIDENTSKQYVKTLKQVLKKAVNSGWLSANPLNGFKCGYVDPEREFLEIHEIMAIYEKEFNVKRLEEVRDVYIFCCFTGYAYETTYNLEPENIYRGLDDQLWISKDRKKTGTKESVPLLPITLDIISKYKSHPYCVKHNKLLPVNSNYKYNAYLQEIADMCDITKHLTTHTARHTFATTITLENDVPIETVSKMLGHKSIRTTQIYAKITKRKISNNMGELRNKLFDENGLLKAK